MSDNLNEQTKEEKRETFRGDVFDWLDVVIASVIAVVIIFTFIFRVVTIDGESMMNTLLNNEKVIISNMFYTPAKGDIVVISRNVDNSIELGTYAEPIIKRVIATAGQTVDINFETGKVSIDGIELDEPYTRTLTTERHLNDIEFPVTVPEGHIFVMGDNRNNSLDSRSSTIGDNGMIDTRYVLGKAVYRVFPFNRAGGLYNE